MTIPKEEGRWQPIDTAPRDGTVFLGLFRENGSPVYALTHWRMARNGSGAWCVGTEIADKPPFLWTAVPALPEGAA